MKKIGVILLICFCLFENIYTLKCRDAKLSTIESTFDSQVSTTFNFLGDHNQVLLFKTRNNKVYHSSDSGRNWSEIKNLPDKPADLRISSIVIANNKKHVLLVGADGESMWSSLSNDKIGPDAWHKIKMPARLRDFQPHPKNPNWVAALAPSIECTQPRTTKCSQDLWISTDFGENWSSIWTYVSEYSWAGAGTSNANHANQLFVVDWYDKSGDYRLKWSEPKRLLKSTSFFKTAPEEIAEGLSDFLAIDDDLFIVKPVSGGGLELYTSIDGGDHFLKSKFPHSTIEKRYTILDASEGSVMVSIQHKSNNWGNIYTSNQFGSDYSLSLRYNPRTLWGPCDFSRIVGLDGIYIGNQFTDVDDDEDNPRGSDIITRMSWDKGGSWHRLPVPANERHHCPETGDCYLNLHGTTTNRRGKFYSERTAIGILLGTGNVGPLLRDRDEDLNTYLSRDAGKTWTFIRNGSHEFDIANHGGMIVITDADRSTNKVSFTLNEGLTWTTCDMTDEPFEVTDIISEPTGGEPQFVVYGHRQSKGVIVHLDFTEMHERTCKGLDNPNDPNSDYEIWTPEGTTGNKCLLGQQISYVRKKRNVECLNLVTYEPRRPVANCSCTREDYQCDFCFERKHGECVLDSKCGYDPKKPPEDCDGFWWESQGYRIIPGDTCVPERGVDLRPIKRTCPPVAPHPLPTPSSSHPNSPSGVSEPDKPASGVSMALVLGVPVVAIIVFAIGIMYALSGRNAAVRSIMGKCIPESYLPTFVEKDAVQYAHLSTNNDDDFSNARVSVDHDQELQDDAPVVDTEKGSADDEEFNPRQK